MLLPILLGKVSCVPKNTLCELYVTMGIKWNSGSLLDMEAHMPSATQNNSKKNKKKQPRKEEYP